MKKPSLSIHAVLIASASILIVAMATPVAALDAYRDRRGFFSGIGVGGGGALQDGDPGGAIMMDFQAGGGASQNLTLCLDLDLWFHLMDDHNNLLITPGPEVNYFFGDSGIFVRAGIGMALATRWEKDYPAGEDDTFFNIGFNGSLGGGWEFFGNSNLALGLALEGEYVLVKAIEEVSHIVTMGFAMNLRFY
ncbi:MAG: hypothetical protein QNJ97_16955 [Myxococcota bacterium]|nr:hypothetical protein [Myxococcota bacterium]